MANSDTVKGSAPARLSNIGAPLAAFAMRRPVTICMFFLAMLILGAVSSRLLPLEKFPGIDIPQIMIQVPYPDATPAEVERLITRPLEEALATLQGVREMRSFSGSNGSNINLMFRWGDSLASRNLEAREKVDSIRHLLPDDVERVFVYQFNTDDMPVMQLRISSDQDLSMAYELLDRQLKQPLERVQGVSRVTLYGVDPAEIVIRLNPTAMSAAGLSVSEVSTILNQANFTMTAGYVETDRNRYLVKPDGEFRNLDDIRRLPVTPHLTVNDIADVGMELPRRNDGRHFRQTYAVGIDIFKESSANLVEVAHAASDVIDHAQESSEFARIELMMFDNTADSVTTSLRDLLAAGLLGASFSVIVLWLFIRDWRLTLVIVTSVPVAICLTLGVMYLLGYSLNVLSLMGLMLAVGMLIDNAVVVSESIKQEQHDTYDKGQVPDKNTVLNGAGRVSLAIIAGTLTTAIVFLPNIFGEQSEITVFLEHAAIAICLSLLASLAVAQTLIPLLISKLKVAENAKSVKRSRIKDGYLATLRWSHRHPRLTTFFTLIIVASTAFPFTQVSGDETATAYNNRLFINYNIDGQYTLDQVEREVSRLEEFLYANKDDFELEDVYTYYTTTYANSVLLLKEDRKLSVAEIQRRVRDNWPGLPRSKPRFGFGGSATSGAQITLQGRSTSELERLATEIIPLLERIPGLEDVQTDTGNANRELRIRINREQAERFGLNVQEVAGQIAVALRGRNLRSFRHSPSGDVRINLTYPEQYYLDQRELQSMAVTRVDNTLITLDQIASFDIVEQLGTIRRFDRQTAIRITANLDDLSLDQAGKEITQVMNNLQLPAGYQWSLQGGFQQQQDQQSLMLINMLLAILLVYMVMAALFESLLLPSAVIGSLFLAIVGVFWGLMITGTNLDMMALIGLLILMGIVVNNGIVLVDSINQHVDEGHALEDAIIGAASRRARPIMMTVCTTVLGMLPLAAGDAQIGGDGPPYTSMAITIIAGLVFSTVTSLVFVPHAYSRLIFWRNHWAQVWHKATPAAVKRAQQSI